MRPVGVKRLAGVGAIAVATACGRTFPPRGTQTLLQFFPHDLFEQDLHGAHGQTPQILPKLLLVQRNGGR
jgi:hypothetical protein